MPYRFSFGILALFLFLLKPAISHAEILKWAELPQVDKKPYTYFIDYNNIKTEDDGWTSFLLEEIPKPGYKFKHKELEFRDKNAASYLEHAAINPQKKLVKLIDIKAYNDRNKVIKEHVFLDTIQDESSNPVYPMAKEFIKIYTLFIKHQGPKANISQFAYAAQAHVYITELQLRLKEYWKPPIIDKEAAVSFAINRTGTVISPTVTKSSSIKKFDKQALKTIKKSAPFPPFPSNWKQESVKIELVFKKGISITGKGF